MKRLSVFYIKCLKRRLKVNKVAIITGSSGDIGSELVNIYLKDNYFVIGVDYCNQSIQNENYVHIKEDLNYFSEKKNLKESFIIDIKKNLPNNITDFIIINNAANQILKEISSLTIDDWSNTLGVNLLAPFFMIQSFFDLLSKYNGKVLNISSIHAKQTKANFSAYAASKAALESLTRSLAIELSPHGISINTVSPAAIDTKMLMEGFKDDLSKIQELKNAHPTKSIASSKELASFVKTITDHKGKFLTGSVIDFNGGISSVLHDPN